ncbi:MAG: hypothetical protein ONB31_10390 [candidate division KSB1 bacterium]|nr:hypothetical protein [candidate division KSB1 bacterium]MDZ7335160.1 hypothetical protein [candidate division KSB1 bacterium]MDZ7356843.1 hypothetical protein [candidate division KSB1 bacterium]MDZ7401318.1 hypothetical protein [candidate division KSB1 bacterium]
MPKKVVKWAGLISLLLIVLSSSLSFSQFEPETQPVPRKPDEGSSISSGSWLQEVPPEYWFSITALKTVSIIIVLLAFILGFVSYFIGMGAGARINKREIRNSILPALIISIFARPIPILVHKYLGLGFSYIMPESYAYGLAGFIVYIFWMLYIIAIPVFLYESFVVTAKEAHPAQF